MPEPREAVEGTADDLAGPLDHEGVRLCVVGARERRRQPGMQAVRFGRSLVEVELVPGGRPGLDLTRQLAVLVDDGRRRYRLAGLGVLLVGGDREVDRRESLGLDDLVGQRSAVGIEGGLGIRLIGAGDQAALLARGKPPGRRRDGDRKGA